MPKTTPEINSDEQELAALGYKQELRRNWSAFSNFAISFSIICILSGGLTSFGQAWNNGGPAVIAIGWPVICGLVLILGLCMAELVSAYPTSGGLYWWASHLGGPKAGFYTGWLNMIGLWAAVAAVGYGAATFFDATVSSYSSSWTASYSLTRVFIEFTILLVIAVSLNLYGSHLLALTNRISAWWLLGGVAIIVAVLIIVPAHHESIGWVFTHRINNSGFASSRLTGFGFWLYVLPLGFLLTQYTIAGFDASAHMSEETTGANRAAASGLWKAILYSSIAGWIMELAFLFAVQPGVVGKTATGQAITGPNAVSAAGGTVQAIFAHALSSDWAGFLLILSTVAQVFCTIAILTSASRMTFAFSRDGAVPLAKKWRVVRNQVPANAVLLAAGVAFVMTIPALFSVRIGGGPVPIAFYAVVSVAVISLYLAYGIPIWLRWKARDRFIPGPWSLGRHFRWMCLVAVAEVVVVSFYFIFPTTPAGVPFRTGFSWESVNYAPILTIGSLIILWLAWHISVKKWFKGPIRYTTVEALIGEGAVPVGLLELEHTLEATGESPEGSEN